MSGVNPPFLASDQDAVPVNAYDPALGLPVAGVSDPSPSSFSRTITILGEVGNTSVV